MSVSVIIQAIELCNQFTELHHTNFSLKMPVKCFNSKFPAYEEGVFKGNETAILSGGVLQIGFTEFEVHYSASQLLVYSSEGLDLELKNSLGILNIS